MEAYPDIADNYVTVITQWAGRSAEEVEQQVTIPIEIQMAGMPHMTFLRSESIFGLSFVIMIFDDTSVNDWNRQKVLERLTQVDLPDGQNLDPQIGTDWSTTGQIYLVHAEKHEILATDLIELRSLEDWVLLKQFKSVPNVVDVSDFGGTEREYQVRVDPNKLVTYGLSIGQIEQQLASNNINAGGSFVEEGMQQMNVRTLGLFGTVHDIENTLLKSQNGTAHFVSKTSHSSRRARKSAWVTWPERTTWKTDASLMNPTLSRARCICAKARRSSPPSTRFIRKSKSLTTASCLRA